MTWLTPARAAAGPLRHLSLAPSFALHLLGGVILLIGLEIIFIHGPISVFIDGMSRADPLELALIISMPILFIELCIVIAALCTLCWGAGVETWQTSFNRTLSRWFQMTPWLALLLLCFIGAFELIKIIEDAAWDAVDYFDNPAYDRISFFAAASRMLAATVYILLTLWAILTTLAVHREPPGWHTTCRWPAICESCGYALAGLTDEQACPECGRPVTDSKHAPRGTLPEHGPRLLIGAMLRPSATGRRILTRQHSQEPGQALAWGMALTAITAPINMIIITAAEIVRHAFSPHYPISEYISDRFVDMTIYDFLTQFVFGSLIFAASLGVVAAGLILLAGSLHGTFASLFGKRQAMPATCRAACLTAGLMPVWSILATLSLGGAMVIQEWFLQTAYYGASDMLYLGWLVLNALLFVLYLAVSGRIAHAARYANI